jgi:enolase
MNKVKNYEINHIHARQIYDSRGNPTVEVDITLNDGSTGRGMVPSGASTGRFEALELRDNDPCVFNGKGVSKAIEHINGELAQLLVDMDIRDLKAIDMAMIHADGTPDKSRLGANAILGCSIAAAWTGANAQRLPLYRYLGGALANTLPVPMIQMIGGGAHAVNTIDIQDYLIIPLSAASFTESYKMAVNVYNAVKRVFTAKNKLLAVADEGGLWPTDFRANQEGLDILTESIQNAGYKPGVDIGIALDIASSEFYDEKTNKYSLATENLSLDSGQFVEMLCSWVDQYPIVSIEDGTSEIDWDGAKLLTDKLGKRVQLIGDDLFTTNIERIRKGVEIGAANAVLIKMNQIGTVSETIEAIRFTQRCGMLPVVSARSGETEDHTIAHLAVASGAGQLKVGSVVRSERTAKWNEVIRIEEALGKSGRFPSASLFTDAKIDIDSM